MDTEHLRVRAAETQDLATVVDLWNREAGPSLLAGGHGEAQRLLSRDPGALLVAESESGIVGSLIVGWDGWRCHLYRLAVEPSSRRRGVAAALVEAATRRAAEVGARRLDAMVNDANEVGLAFWRAVGFQLDTADSRWSLLLSAGTGAPRTQ